MFGIVSAAVVLLVAAQSAETQPAFELKGHDRPVLDVAFSPDGKRLATVADDGVLRVWDVSGRAELAVFKGCTTNRNRACWTADGAQLVAIGDEPAIRRWDVPGRKELSAIPMQDISGGAHDIALSPDGKRLAIVGRSTLRIHDMGSGAEVGRHVVHEQYGVDVVVWSADGATIVTGGTDRKVMVLAAADGTVRRVLETNGRPSAMALTADGKSLFVATDNRIVQQFDLATSVGETIDLGSRPAHDLQLSADGKLLIIGGPGRGPVIYDLAARQVREGKLESDDWVKPAAISPDGKLIVGGANGGAIYGWMIER